MTSPAETALGDLTAAETALLNYMARLSAAEADEDENGDYLVDAPDMIPLFGAVLLNLSRAAGLIEAVVLTHASEESEGRIPLGEDRQGLQNQGGSRETGAGDQGSPIP